MMLDGIVPSKVLSERRCEHRTFHAVYERNIRRVYRLCYLKLGHREDAEDAAQNVFVRYLKGDKQFASEEHERAYFLRAAINECINIEKSRWRRGRCDMEELPDAVISVSEEDAFAESNSLDGARMLLDRLPARYREVMYLYYCEELPTKTIARLLSRRESTVRTQLQTGREKLREILEKGEAK